MCTCGSCGHVDLVDIRPSVRPSVRTSSKMFQDVQVHDSSRFFTILHDSSRFFTILHDSSRFFTILHDSSRFFTILHDSSRFFTVLHGSSRFFTILHDSSRPGELQQGVKLVDGKSGQSWLCRSCSVLAVCCTLAHMAL